MKNINNKVSLFGHNIICNNTIGSVSKKNMFTDIFYNFKNKNWSAVIINDNLYNNMDTC